MPRVECPLFYPIQSIRLHARRFAAGYSFPPHAQPVHQFYCVLAGEVSQRVEGATHRLRAGEAVWVAPGLERAPRAVSAAGEYLVVQFSAPWPELGAGTGGRCRLGAAALADARALATFRTVATDDHRVAVLFHHLCLRLLPPAWFTRLARAEDSRAGRKPVTPGADRVERIERLMAANTGNALRLEDIAALAGMSRSALGRLFMAQRRRSPCARFRELRLDRAKQLLMHGGRSVTEVALETGFSSSQHFAGAFRRRFWRPPSAFSGREG